MVRFSWTFRVRPFLCVWFARAFLLNGISAQTVFSAFSVFSCPQFSKDANRKSRPSVESTLSKNLSLVPARNLWGSPKASHIKASQPHFPHFRRIGFESLISKIWPAGFIMTGLRWPGSNSLTVPFKCPFGRTPEPPPPANELPHGENFQNISVKRRASRKTQAIFCLESYSIFWGF